MKKGPWAEPEEPDDPSSLAAYEEFRRYREFTRRYQEQERQQQRQQNRRERVMRGLVQPGLAALAGAALIWAAFSYGPAVRPWLSSLGSSPSAAQATRIGPFRNCAAARAAGAAPLRRGQPGYAYHLDADGDGIACEWSWRNLFR
jgi:Excalibur calcium-binding domain